MTRLVHRRTFVAGVATLLVSCGRRVYLYADHKQFDRGLHVTVYEAYARNDRIYLEARVFNRAGVSIRVDRGGWSLSLPSGELLPRSVGVTTDHDLIEIAPGDMLDVHVDFKKEDHDLTQIETATLHVGGILFGDDPTPHVAGTIALSTTLVAPTLTSRASTAPSASPEPTAAPTTTPSAAPSASATAAPSVSSTAAPSVSPSAAPNVAPSASSTPAPSASPSAAPSASPSAPPTAVP